MFEELELRAGEIAKPKHDCAITLLAGDIPALGKLRFQIPGSHCAEAGEMLVESALRLLQQLKP